MIVLGCIVMSIFFIPVIFFLFLFIHEKFGKEITKEELQELIKGLENGKNNGRH